MSLHGDLIDQAKHLARREKKRPKQASLRRAVSGAYYALFHFLLDQATRRSFGGDSSKRPLRLVFARGFNHGVMKQVSEHFSRGQLPQRLRGSIPQLLISNDLKSVASSFVALQEERHRADYDLLNDFSRGETLLLIDQAEAAMALWSGIKHEDAAQLFLAALPIWDKMIR